MGPAGLLLVDKPRGITSHDVIDRLRRVYGIRKIGHAGTLDPLATGLLICLVARPATRLQSRFMGLDKVYRGRMVLGVTTETQDTEGEILEKRPVPELEPTDFEAVFNRYTGAIKQVPPLYSALKHKGKPLYEYARAGKKVKRKAREVTIHRFDHEGRTENRIQFEVHCSKGTYIRTLVHDVGEELGCGAHLDQLRRLAIGSWQVEDATTLKALEALPLEEAIDQLIPVDQLG